MVQDLPDRSNVAFDDERVVVNAGIVLAVTLARRLGIEALVDAAVDSGSGRGRRTRAARCSRWCTRCCWARTASMTAMCCGRGGPRRCSGIGRWRPRRWARFCVRLRSGMCANSTACSARRWLRVAGRRGPGQTAPGDRHRLLRRRGLRARQAGPGIGYTKQLGYHPLLATRADSGEVLHVRLRKGQANTQRGALRFVEELLARVRRAGATGQILIRADSGFWNRKLITRLRQTGCLYSIGIRQNNAVAARIARIPDSAWQPVPDYPDSGVCELAETALGDDRLIVRRVHLHAQEAQAELFTYWRHFALITNRTDPIHTVDSEHRQHAVIELVIRDLKDQALAHFPSGHYSANSAWTVIACLAHNLARWTSLLGTRDPTPRAARTLRHRLLALPGRLTRTARQWTLHLPARWPWQHDFIRALARIRALPAAT